MSTCIQVRHLTKLYGHVAAVNRLSLEIRTGEIFGILGPNGAGKSTTLYMLAGLVRPSTGSITIFGKDLKTHFLDISARMGVLVENPAFYNHMTVAQNLSLLARLSGKEVNLERILDMVGMAHLLNASVGRLSRGMTQRLGLAQAFLTEPELLVLDEPTSALDTEHTQEILALLKRLSKDAAVTVIMSSHRMDEVEALCDRIAILNQGQLVTCDRTDALLSYDTATLEVLIDSPQAAGRRLLQEDWVESVEVHTGRVIVRLREPNPHQLTAFLVGAGFKVSGIIPRRRTLREYFLKALNA